MSKPNFQLGDVVQFIGVHRTFVANGCFRGINDSRYEAHAGDRFTVVSVVRGGFGGHAYFMDLEKDGMIFSGVICSDFLLVERGSGIYIRRNPDNPKTVIAMDLATGKTAEAKCAPGDPFDFYKGAELAFSRLTKRSEDSKPKYWTGKVVCVKGARSFTEGKVYNVENGCLYCNSQGVYISQIKNFREMEKFFNITFMSTGPQFIEFKGE